MAKKGRSERGLLASERSFRLLVQGVVDYAIFLLDPQGIVANWNAGAERIKGYSADEIIGQHFSRFYSDADRAKGRPARALHLAETTGRYEEEGWRVRKDGSFFWASVVIDPIRDDERKLLGFAKITRDITERREAQQRLEKIQRQLAESQKLDALGQLTGGVAHDFNNLLMILSGNIHTLKKHVGDDAKAQRAIQAIEGAAQRGAALTRQLLSFARRQRVNPETIDVAERINSVRQVLATGLGTAVTLLIDAEPDLWPITVDPAEFETALVNLTINARDAMPDGGVVMIKAKNVTIDQAPNNGEHVVISVGDNGVGIPKDIVSKVFDPFFTTKPVGKGTGLGLSQVHGFAHQAGGTVSLSSELGEGTTITLCLPRGTPAPQSSSATMNSGGTGTVLLVEDNPEVAYASTGLLEQLGYSVRWVSNADAALREIDHDEVDLVLSDIVMPGNVDGLRLAHAIRAKRPALPVLLASGYSEAAQRAHSDFPILRKPYQIHELSRALAKLTH